MDSDDSNHNRRHPGSAPGLMMPRLGGRRGLTFMPRRAVRVASIACPLGGRVMVGTPNLRLLSRRATPRWFGDHLEDDVVDVAQDAEVTLQIADREATESMTLFQLDEHTPNRDSRGFLGSRSVPRNVISDTTIRDTKTKRVTNNLSVTRVHETRHRLVVAHAPGARHVTNNDVFMTHVNKTHHG
jgi:hypothetical protein